MQVILSIKPEFAYKIFSGEKKFEFRRSLFKNEKVKKIIVYASAPVSMVVGEFDIERIHHLDLENLWKLTKKHSGITKDYYLSYFEGKDSGYAIAVKSSNLYETEVCIQKVYGIRPPQSFAYVKEVGTHMA